MNVNMNKMNKNMVEEYAMAFMLEYTENQYKNDKTLEQIKNELINVIINKDEYLKIWTPMSYSSNEKLFIKQMTHLKDLLMSLQNEKTNNFEEWLKSSRYDKKEFERFTDGIYDFLKDYNKPLVNWCHLDIYSYRFRRPLLIYILNTSNYALMSKYIHTIDKYLLASLLTQERKDKISRYLKISNQINLILLQSKICKDVIENHLNPMINPKIEDIRNYTNWQDFEDQHYDELDFHSDNE